MAPTTQAHHRSHSLLLLQKLLNLRDTASPLTLVLDTLEQSASPLIQEFTTRAKIAGTKIIFISFATIKKPLNADVFVKARGKPLETLAAEVKSHCASKEGPAQKVLVIIDSLNSLASTQPRFLPAFLTSIVTQTVSLVAVYHADVPLVLPREHSEYEPHPLTVLSHLATAIFRISSLHQAVEQRRARDRSLQEPEWGLREGREGVLVGVKGGRKAAGAGNGNGPGLVLEMEMRRRSGRAVVESFVLATRTRNQKAEVIGVVGPAAVTLLSDHPLFARPTDGGGSQRAGGDGDGEDMETTFNLGLTEKQRRDREGIVLPYFDAQSDVGGGEGGRILYEMDREDDFDEEEDEI